MVSSGRLARVGLAGGDDLSVAGHNIERNWPLLVFLTTNFIGHVRS
jgi:hypothetical protein